MGVHIARQPVLNRNSEVYAYELLFRAGTEDQESLFHDGKYATAQVIIGVMESFGLLEITGGKKALINFNGELLRQGIPSLLPAEHTGIELLEEIEYDAELIESCRSLKEAGYMLLLDDFVYSQCLLPLIDLADIIKVDFKSTTGHQRQRIMDIPSFKGRFLAEKVETKEDFQQAVELGYSLFQGFYFCKPDLISRREIPSFKRNYFQLLQEVNAPDPDFDYMEKIIKREISLCYRLFKLINSAYYGFSQRIDSIRHALVLLGINEIKRWLDLYLMSGIGRDSPNILLLNTYIRARFAESLASVFALEDRKMDLFMIGLFSMLDVFFARPLSEILQDLELEKDVIEALLERRGLLGQILTLVEAYEKARWERVMVIIDHNQLDHEQISDMYMEAVTSSQAIIKMVTE